MIVAKVQARLKIAAAFAKEGSKGTAKGGATLCVPGAERRFNQPNENVDEPRKLLWVIRRKAGVRRDETFHRRR